MVATLKSHPPSLLSESFSHRPVYPGMRGESVAEVQAALVQEGYELAVDGVFGQQTRAAVEDFQEEQDLQVDGIVGPETAGALRAGEARAPTERERLSGPKEGEVRAGELARADDFRRAASERKEAAASRPRSLVTRGTIGADVLRAQQLLNKAGYDPGGTDGIFGPRTEAAVKRFQRARGLDVDGKVGSATWSALDAPPPATEPPPTKPVGGVQPSPTGDAALRARILEIAEGEVGNQEATNRNDGEILKYPRFFGRGSEAWCADFVSWVNTKAGNPMNEYNCEMTRRAMIDEGRWKGKQGARPGDIVLFDWNGDRRADHIGILKAVNSDGTFTTIEGNTSLPGENEGVWERRRTLATIMGFGNPT